MAGTHLFYNGVLLRDCDLQGWRQEIVRDESNTDVLYSKVTLTAESTLINLFNPAAPPSEQLPIGGIAAPLTTIAIPKVVSENVVDRYHEIQWRLQETRKDFWLALNGVTKLAMPAAGVNPDADYQNNGSYRVVMAATGLTTDDLKAIEADPDADLGKVSGWNDFGLGTPNIDIERKKVIDLNNGPRPISAEVVKVLGGRSLRVRFTIEICRCFCKPRDENYEDTSLPPVLDATKVVGVISNRWSLTELTDENWKTEHQIDGRLVVSDVRYKPHAMRLVVTPKLFPYAKLTNRTYASDRTGLSLAYKFTIKETGPAAPDGITNWSGTYSERHATGGKKLGDVSVRVTGLTNPTLAAPNSADPMQEHKSKLLAFAYRIAQSRIRWKALLQALPGSDPNLITLVDMLVIEAMHEPTLDLRISVMYADAAPAGGMLSDEMGLRLKNMGRSMAEDVAGVQPGYDPKWWPAPEPFPWDIASARQESIDEEYGTYFDCYFQTPCSEWHSMPRGAIPPVDDDPQPIVLLSQAPPIGTLPPGEPIPPAQQGWADGQTTHAYIQADIDTKYSINSGKVQLPLSKARTGVSSGLPPQTCTVIKLHAGLAQRVITMVATREGDWPKVPAPQATVQNGDIVETYLDGEILPNTPKLLKDGKSFVYSMQIRWVYAMSRLPNQSGDKLFAASNPMDRTTPARNQVALSNYFDYGNIEYASSGSGPLFT